VLAPGAVLAGLALVVALGGWNKPLFLDLNAAARSLPAGLWASVTLGGSVLGAIALLAPSLKTQPRWLASALLAAPLATLFSVGGKRFFDVMRPAGVLDEGSFNLIGQKLYVHAFPSGHAVTAFAAAAVVTLAWPRGATRWRVGLAGLAFAGLIALSRIAVGAHWPLDVLAGAAGGWLSGAAGVWLSSRITFLHGPRGARLLACLALLSGLALLVLDLDQPDARLYRIGLAAWGIGGAAAALMNDRDERR